jgi:exosortase K
MRSIEKRSLAGPAVDLVLTLLLLGLVYALKLHYSRAEASELIWVLSPTAALVELLGPMQFFFETDAGYVSRDGSIIIAPVCAGVNFLITALLTGAGVVLLRPASLQVKILRLGAVLGSSYLLTLCINALRILVATRLFQMELDPGWLNPDRLHRLAGIAIYLPSLLCYGLLLQGLLSGNNMAGTLLIALACYLGVGLGIPLLTGNYQQNIALFLEHGVTLLFCSLVVLLISLVVFNARPCK